MEEKAPSKAYTTPGGSPVGAFWDCKVVFGRPESEVPMSLGALRRTAPAPQGTGAKTSRSDTLVDPKRGIRLSV